VTKLLSTTGIYIIKNTQHYCTERENQLSLLTSQTQKQGVRLVYGYTCSSAWALAIFRVVTVDLHQALLIHQHTHTNTLVKTQGQTVFARKKGRKYTIRINLKTNRKRMSVNRPPRPNEISWMDWLKSQGTPG